MEADSNVLWERAVVTSRQGAETGKAERKVMLKETKGNSDSAASTKIETGRRPITVNVDSNDTSGVANGIRKYRAPTESTKYIQIDRHIYDITYFTRFHPGGSVIEHFINRDATDVFRAFHYKNVLKYHTPVRSVSKKYEDPAADEFANLHRFFIENDFFKTSYKWYAMKTGVAFSFLAAAFYFIAVCNQRCLHYAGALSLGLFWQQCGFLMHDFLHSQVTHNRKTDTLLGMFFSSVCAGVNGHWWKDEHLLHHALPCCVDYDKMFCDPQIITSVWAQNPKLYPFFTTYLQRLSVKYQHIIFLPLSIVGGRLEMTVRGFKNETRFTEWICFLVHWCYVIFILSYLPSWREMLAVLLVVYLTFGFLVIQLNINHVLENYYFEKDACNNINWYRMQIGSSTNLVCPVWLDWFLGGMNFHIEHHLYPTMPRHNIREASRHVKRVCNRLGIQYHELPFSNAIVEVLKQLKKVSKFQKVKH